MKGFRSVRLLYWLAGAVALCSPIRPAAAQLNQPLHTDGWILAAAHAPGLQGSIWRTDLWIFTDYGRGTVNLAFCRSNTDNASVTPFVITADGRRVHYLEDVVDHYLHIGDGSWLGAIHYTADVPIQVWARVYSISPDGKKSYGQLIEGIPTAHMSPDDHPWDSRAQQWLFATKHTTDGRYRVNVGIVNPTAVASRMVANMFGPDGELPSTGGISVTPTVPPFSMVQLADPFAAVEGGEWSDHAIRVHANEEGSGHFAYASVVDNATNDAFFVRGVQRFGQGEKQALNCTAHRDGWILAAAHAPGFKGSIWRTDLWIAREEGSPATMNLTFCRAGQDNSAAAPVPVSFAAGANVVYFEDVVEHYLGVGDGSWTGAIHYTADFDVQVWARVYSISPDGAESYGQLVEGIPSADASPSWKDVTGVKDLQYIFAMKHTADDRFRVNVGVVNPSAIACVYRVAIFTSTFSAPGTGSFEPYVTVPPYSMVQLTDPFAAVDGGEWHDYSLQLLCDTSGGQGFLYASVVDNATNDAYFVRGIKRLPDDGS